MRCYKAFMLALPLAGALLPAASRAAKDPVTQCYDDNKEYHHSTDCAYLGRQLDAQRSAKAYEESRALSRQLSYEAKARSKAAWDSRVADVLRRRRQAAAAAGN